MTQKKSLSERLIEGAGILGRLWKRNRRCASRGWSIPQDDYLEEPFAINSCECSVQNEFCKGRLLWITLAADNRQEIVTGDHGLAFTMTSQQWDATGLTITLPIEGGQVTVGPKGSMSMAHFRELAKDPKGSAGIFALIKAFPKARIDGILAAGVVGGATGLPANQGAF